MPQANVWIREEDWEVWKAIPDRPKWLHGQLEHYSETATRKVKLPQLDKPITVPSNRGTCKNGHVTDEWGYCLARECKYSRF